MELVNKLIDKLFDKAIDKFVESTWYAKLLVSASGVMTVVGAYFIKFEHLTITEKYVIAAAILIILMISVMFWHCGKGKWIEGKNAKAVNEWVNKLYMADSSMSANNIIGMWQVHAKVTSDDPHGCLQIERLLQSHSRAGNLLVENGYIKREDFKEWLLKHSIEIPKFTKQPSES